MIMNNIKKLNELGQSVWLDFIGRKLISSGELKRKIDEQGISGMTSNPSIFEKAIGETEDYNDEISILLKSGVNETNLLYEALVIRDIQDAADLFKPTYLKTNGQDGFVSMEVSPKLAHNPEETIKEAQRLWKLVGRENVMIKVPGTSECISAIKHLTALGINVNVTLLFSVERYQEVLEAFADGLVEASKKPGSDIKKISSVASFFVSRIDTAIDRLILKKMENLTDINKRNKLSSLQGKVANSCAALAYEKFLESQKTNKWKMLIGKGARPQRLLWASTSTKNKDYSDLLYVEELIGNDTVTTLTNKTLQATIDHGNINPTIINNIKMSENILESLKEAGISLNEVTHMLLAEGIEKFTNSFDKLLNSISHRRKVYFAEMLNTQVMVLPSMLQEKVDSTLIKWNLNRKMEMLWRGDSALWTGKSESEWMGWLNLVDDGILHLSLIQKFVEEIKNEGFTDILILGMGGSSLCPEVISGIFKPQINYPKLHILDSTDPEQIQEIEKKINLKSTLFIVSSKSGSTLEPNIFLDYFFGKIKDNFDEKNPGKKFVAITDPGTSLELKAKTLGFRKIFHGKPDVGGRYSALSDFGMVPLALIGSDLKEFFKKTQYMMRGCDSYVSPEDNPGAVLGITLATAALEGKNKVTFICSKKIQNFGIWIEQILAESTGKNGKGVIPINGETLTTPDFYDNDRIFVHLKVKGDEDVNVEKKLFDLGRAGHPLIEIVMKDIYNLGQEFFRWEMATAVAGSVLGINPFDQPDVEASKVATKELTDQYEKNGIIELEKPLYEEGSIQVFSSKEHSRSNNNFSNLADVIKNEFYDIKAGDYFGILAYLPMNSKNQNEMQKMRLNVRDKKKIATCLEFGPRFLHSTGQVYKGGPNIGVFLEVTSDHEKDLAIPDHHATFGIIEMAQAKGDFKVLTTQKKRRGLRIHFKKDVDANLIKLSTAIENALKL
jgi:transaldolase/glucose-6-phosphate isomerase